MADDPAPVAVADDRQLFASSTGEPRRRSGVSTWLIVAASVVVGILIGFASGYRTGQGQVLGSGVEPGSGSAPTSGATAGKPFSESTVDDPVRLEEEPVVPVPEPPPAAAGSVPTAAGSAPTAAGSAPTAPDRRGTRPTERGTRPTERPAKPPVATGPGSLQVLSRPAGAQVILDGQVVGRTPLTIPEVSAGPHDIRLELPGFNRWATKVDVPAGMPARVAASLEQ